jgi:hypothetical protein
MEKIRAKEEASARAAFEVSSRPPPVHHTMHPRLLYVLARAACEGACQGKPHHAFPVKICFEAQVGQP